MNTPKAGNIYMLLILAFQFIGIFVISAVYIVTQGRLNITGQLVLSQIISFFVPFIIYKICSKEKLSDILSLKFINFGNILLILVLCILIQPVMMLVSSLSASLFGNQTEEVFSQLNDFSFWTFLLTMAVMPAIFEEITFRGVIFHTYKKIDFKKAALINGLFFGLMHTNLHQFFYAFILGSIFALFVHYTGSILASVWAHFVINGSQVALVKLTMVYQEYYEALGEPVGETEAVMELSLTGIILYQTMILLVFGGAFLLLFKYFRDYNNRHKQALELQERHQANLMEAEAIPADVAEPIFLHEIPAPERDGGVHLPTFIITVVLYALVTIFYTFL